MRTIAVGWCFSAALTVATGQSPSGLMRSYVKQNSAYVLVDAAPFVWELARQWHSEWSTLSVLRHKELGEVLDRLRALHVEAGNAAIASQLTVAIGLVQSDLTPGATNDERAEYRSLIAGSGELVPRFTGDGLNRTIPLGEVPRSARDSDTLRRAWMVTQYLRGYSILWSEKQRREWNEKIEACSNWEAMICQRCYNSRLRFLDSALTLPFGEFGPDQERPNDRLLPFLSGNWSDFDLLLAGTGSRESLDDASLSSLVHNFMKVLLRTPWPATDWLSMSGSSNGREADAAIATYAFLATLEMDPDLHSPGAILPNYNVNILVDPRREVWLAVRRLCEHVGDDQSRRNLVADIEAILEAVDWQAKNQQPVEGRIRDRIVQTCLVRFSQPHRERSSVKIGTGLYRRAPVSLVEREFRVNGDLVKAGCFALGCEAFDAKEMAWRRLEWRTNTLTKKEEGVKSPR